MRSFKTFQSKKCKVSWSIILLVSDVATTTYLDTTGYDPSVTTAGGTTLVDTTGQPFYTSVMSPTAVTPYATTSTHPGGQTSNILNLPPDAIVTSQQSGSGGLLAAAALPQTPVTTLSSSVDMHHHQMAPPQFILHEEHVPQQSDNRIDLGQIVRQTIETNHLQQFDLQVS